MLSRPHLFPIAFLLLGLSFLLNLSLGSVMIPFGEIVSGILSGEWTSAVVCVPTSHLQTESINLPKEPDRVYYMIK